MILSLLKNLKVQYFTKAQIFRLKGKGVIIGGNAKFRGFTKWRIYGTLRIGKNFTLNSGQVSTIDNSSNSKILVYKEAEMTIGDNVGMSNVAISCKSKIYIGNFVQLGAGCMIMDSNHHDIDWERRRIAGGNLTAQHQPIFIDDDVFIGARSIICKGVTIGKHSVVAAGSVVVKDIPENEIWGGNPAKFIKKL